MKRKNAGLLSLGAVALALAAAAQSLFQESIVLGTAYMILSSLSVPVVLFAFCAKCPDRSDCGHVLPGSAAAALFSRRKCSPYTAGDLALTSAALAVLLLLPQFRLWKHPIAFGFFWVAMLAAGAGIRTRVCPGCGNSGCPGHRDRSGRAGGRRTRS
jgi:hypothetical protein